MKNTNRILLPVVLILSMIIALSACGNKIPVEDNSSNNLSGTTSMKNSFENSDERNSQAMVQSTDNINEIFQAQDKILERINNNTPSEDIIKKLLDIDLFIKEYANIPYVSVTANPPPTIKQMDEIFGIECIRKTSAETLYSVHKVKQGGMLYVFYETNNQLNQNYEQVFNWIYVTQKLSYSDFASIKKDDSIESVELIDSCTSIYKERMIKYGSENSGAFSTHYLKDGILTIFYSYDDGKYKVDHRTYHNDFQLDFYWHAVTTPYNGKVLPIDFVK